MKPDTRARAIKALNLSAKNITGDELAARLKCDPDTALQLVRIGVLIDRAEGLRLTQRERTVFKIICRIIARNVMAGRDWTKTADVDFSAGQRSGWCGRLLVGLTAAGLIVMPQVGRIALTNAGWAFAWTTGLIKPNWKVPT